MHCYLKRRTAVTDETQETQVSSSKHHKEGPCSGRGVMTTRDLRCRASPLGSEIKAAIVMASSLCAHQTSPESVLDSCLTFILHLSVWHELRDHLSLPPCPRVSFYLPFEYLPRREKRDGEREESAAQERLRGITRRAEEEDVRWDRGEWQMGPKKRGLLGSALRQSWAYDSFTVGSVCVPVCVCASWLDSPCVHAHARVRALAPCQCLPTAFSVCWASPEGQLHLLSLPSPPFPHQLQSSVPVLT